MRVARRALIAATTAAVNAAFIAALIAIAGATPAAAQPGARTVRDTLRLGELQRAAERVDRRAAQADLLSEQARLRLRAIRDEHLPALGLLGMAQYLSDVPSVGLPGGPPPPPHDNYDAHVSLRQRLLDPTRAPRREVERAQLAESEARLRTALYQQRALVQEAFFAMLRLDAQRATIEVAVGELEAQREAAARRVAEGAALPSESRTIEAELLRRRQALGALAADREAARDVLASLTGRDVPADAVLALPLIAPNAADETDAADAVARGAAGRSRPEFTQFARGRELLGVRRAAVTAQERPRVSAFARAGYGRPGLNPLATAFDAYWLAGVQVEWAPWDWGARAREAQVLTIQAQILATEEAAFAANLDRDATRARAAVAQLERTLEDDDRLVELQRAIHEEARLRFSEAVITSAEYLDRQGDLLAAELARATHRVQLAEAQARLLTTLGVEIR